MANESCVCTSRMSTSSCIQTCSMSFVQDLFLMSRCPEKPKPDRRKHCRNAIPEQAWDAPCAELVRVDPVFRQMKQSMEPARESDARAIWSLLWRSTIFVPLMVPIAVLWLVIGVSIVLLPLIGVLHLWFGLWRDAAICFVVWAIVVWTCRRFRFAAIWESPPSFL
jgi:hypothetical protein